MSFCSFSKECDDNAYTLVENKFIAKYLPQADGFCVKVYLYGLYLCRHTETEFGITAMAKALSATETDVKNAFLFWEECDLVEILSKDPFAVSYLPVKTALGRPKKIRYEQYADFNKELQRMLQKVGKFVTASDYVKYMRFLEENDIHPQAFLLIAEYCVNKQGESVSPSYIFNKAKKFIRNGWTSYDLVEKELAGYNAHEKDLSAIFACIGVFRSPDESDYALYKKWLDGGFTLNAVLTAGKKIKRGSMNALDLTLCDLKEKNKLSATEIESYLTERDLLANLTFRIGRKLGTKVANPAPYIDEYVEKWFNYGFEESSLLDIALYCLKTDRGDFGAMHGVIEKFFADGIVAKESVKALLKAKNDELKLFTSVQGVCGGIRKSVANLALIQTWRDWKFSDEMILEAAKRASTSASPIPYMNKILSDWKRAEIFSLSAIPDGEQDKKSTYGGAKATSAASYAVAAVEAANAKSDRERYYALKREQAQTVADKFLAKANANKRFKELSSELSKMEIALAKAEVFEPKSLPELEQKKSAFLLERKSILDGLGIPEQSLLPQYECLKCSDTGFLKSGIACDCYKKI